MAHRRPLLVRITLVAAVAALLILVPLGGAGSEVWQRLALQLGEPIPDETPAGVIASAIEDGDDEDDDQEDDEDDEEDGEDDEDDQDDQDDQDDDDDDSEDGN